MSNSNVEPQVKLHAVGHLRRTLPSIYDLAGLRLPSKCTPGQALAAEYGRSIESEPLGALFGIVDEITALYRFLGTGFLIGSAKGKRDADIWSLHCAKAVANLASIRSLCSLGFDGNARIQLRLHYETMVLWSRLRVDSTATRDFRAANTPEKANHFWQQYLARQKSEKYIRATIPDGSVWMGFAEEFVERTQSIFGISSHPSRLEMGFNLQEEWRGATAHDSYVIRRVPPSSHFTLGTAIWISTFPLVVGKSGLIEVFQPPDWVPPEVELISAKDPAEDYYAILQKAVSALFMFAQPFVGGLRALTAKDEL